MVKSTCTRGCADVDRVCPTYTAFGGNSAIPAAATSPREADRGASSLSLATNWGKHVGKAAPTKQHGVVALACKRRGRAPCAIKYRGAQVLVPKGQYARLILQPLAACGCKTRRWFERIHLQPTSCQRQYLTTTAARAYKDARRRRGQASLIPVLLPLPELAILFPRSVGAPIATVEGNRDRILLIPGQRRGCKTLDATAHPFCRSLQQRVHLTSIPMRVGRWARHLLLPTFQVAREILFQAF
jgi:hypothetical protein